VEKGFFKAGKIVRSHGKSGTLIARLEPGFPEDPAEIEFLFVMIAGGLVPFKIISISMRNERQAGFQLQDMDSENKESLLIGADIYLPDDLKEQSEEVFDLESLIGFTVIDQQGRETGVIEELLRFDLNAVFRLNPGGIELLLPANVELMINIDPLKNQLIMQIPEGLIDLYLGDSESQNL
jgi:16S rRNA processing protein RimM